jgi:phage tail sheath protein FI
VLSLERHVTHVRHEIDSTPSRINCIRSFPGRGIRVWGARTLSGNDAWTYVNVRRIFLTAIRWLEWHMKSVVFEPNDAKLWAQIEGQLHQYFLGLYRQGALQGPTAQAAYYVRCNARTNPREVIESGHVVAEVGLAAAMPFEFVVVRLIYGASGVSISGPTRPEQNS